MTARSFAIAGTIVMIAGGHAAAQNLDSLVLHARGFAARQLARTVAELGSAREVPVLTLPDGSWKTAKPSDWRSGFFAGSLWYLYEERRDTALRNAAERWTAVLEEQKLNNHTHDVGFMIYCSYGNGYRLERRREYKEVLLEAARTLATRFDKRVGCIKSWDGRREWQYPVIIDNMMNLELLFWAARNGGGGRLRQIALRHALTTIRNHFRTDGSTYHVVDYDTTTGTVRVKQTHQGFADESVWARGQAWAIYGFTMAYRETRDRRFLAAAERAADYFIDHLPKDSVPYWDFKAPGIPNEERDASAGAIAASALFELGKLEKRSDAAKKYRTSAERILASLCSPVYLAEGSASHGILNHAVGNRPKNAEVDVSLIYADYYFIEAMMRYEKQRSEIRRKSK